MFVKFIAFYHVTIILIHFYRHFYLNSGIPCSSVSHFVETSYFTFVGIKLTGCHVMRDLDEGNLETNYEQFTSVYMCVFMFVGICMCLCVGIYICICMYVYACVYVFVCAYVYICACKCVNVCSMCMCIYMCVYICVCVHVYIYIIYIYILLFCLTFT